MNCPKTKTAWKFKLSIIGAVTSPLLLVAGMLPPLNGVTARIPIIWAVGMLILLLSITTYYEVKDRFWAEKTGKR